MEGRHDQAEQAYARAAQLFDGMSRERLSPEQAKHVRRYAREADLRVAEMVELQKRHDEAQSLYDALQRKASEFHDIMWLAQIGAVRQMVANAQYELAIGRCQDMIKEAESQGQTQYLGGAHLALGDCFFEKAGDKATPEDLVKARWHYVRVATLYFMDERLLPKALFRAGRCYERLSTMSDREGDEAVDRARRNYRRVVELFPGNPWANTAKERLGVLGG
jgi:tetratricopeptide (TPR) repeat protein